MGTSTPTIDPETGERVPTPPNKKDPFAPVDWAATYQYQGEQPITSARPPQIDPETGERIGVTPQQGADMFKAVVHAQMTGTTPGDAYLNREAFDTELKERGG